MPNDYYKALDQLIEQAPPGANGAIYTPWIFGERAPVEDHMIRAGLHNISLNHSRADLIRAIFEGIALNTRWLLDPAERFLKQRCKSIALVGGGAKSDVWCQVFADILQRPIRQIDHPIEANMRGAALIASAALGNITFSEVPSLVRVKRSFEPQTKHQTLYSLHYSEFKNLYRATRRIHSRLNHYHKSL